MSYGVLDRKREIESTQRHLATSQCVTRIASPEEINKILSERGNQMAKRGPKPGFKRDKKVNQLELVDQATIKGDKALASAVRAGIEDIIETALVTERAEPVTEKAIDVTKKSLKDTPLFDWDVLAAQTKGAVLQEQAVAKKPTIDEVKIWPVCTECDDAVDPNNFDHASNTCPSCKHARIEALQFMDKFRVEPQSVKPAATEGEFIDQLKSYTAVSMPSAEPTVEMVNHPKHYNIGSIEVIDAIEDWELSFNLGNAVKYIARARHKGNEMQDLEKAAWYLDREIMKAKSRL